MLIRAEWLAPMFAIAEKKLLVSVNLKKNRKLNKFSHSALPGSVTE